MFSLGVGGGASMKIWLVSLLDDFYSEDVLLVEFMYLVFTHMPGESCRK